jgi:tetratricopeptide (TPR) repeat protein
VGEYGRAAELFADAARLDPDWPLPHFLQVQAHLAAGRYIDAAHTLLATCRRYPHAAQHFDPREPYGSQPQRYTEHLASLRRAVAEHPREPLPAYLLGWQLWWAGETQEARRWWQRARQLAAPTDDWPVAGS